MTLSAVQLWQSIQDNGIADAVSCRKWASEIVENFGGSALNDPQPLLAQLIKLGKITPFQANALISDSVQTLVIGRHRLLAPLTSPALTDWFEAIDPASNASRWLYAIPAQRLLTPSLQRYPPSLLYSRKQASVKGDSLQSMSPPAMLDGFLLVAATPAAGKPLRDQLKNQPAGILPKQDAMNIVHAIATALADLHDQLVVHGKIGIDQIWWDGSKQVTLLRDPFFPPVSPLVSDSPMAVGVIDDPDFRIRYAAPEFTSPAQQPTPATDMYALGCLWWELITGKLPYWGTMMDQVPTSACMFPLPIPKDAGLSQGEQHCLEYLLAKTPSARFQNGRSFLKALDIVFDASGKPVVHSQSSNAQSDRPAASIKAKEPSPIKPLIQALEATPPSKAITDATPETGKPATLKPSKAEQLKVESPSTRSEVAPPKVPQASIKVNEEAITSAITSKVVASQIEPRNVKAEKQKVVVPAAVVPPAVAPPIVVLSVAEPTISYVNPKTEVAKSQKELLDFAKVTPAAKPVNTILETSEAIAPMAKDNTAQTRLKKRTDTTTLVGEPKAKELTGKSPKNIDAQAPEIFGDAKAAETNGDLYLETKPQPIPPPQKIPPSETVDPSVERGGTNSELLHTSNDSTNQLTDRTKHNPTTKSVPKKLSASVKSRSATSVRNRRKKKPAWIFPTIIIASGLFLVLVVFVLLNNQSKGIRNTGNQKTAAIPNQNSTDAKGLKDVTPLDSQDASKATVVKTVRDELAEHYNIAKDASEFPWLPPRPPKPISLQGLPPGLQGLVAIRVNQWNQEARNQPIYDVLRSQIDRVLPPIKNELGLDVSEIQTVAIGLYAGREDGWPELAYRITLKEPTSLEELTKRWKDFQEEKVGETSKIYTRGARAIFSTPGTSGEESKIGEVSLGSHDQMKEVAELDGAGSALTRSLASLWQTTDAESDLTVLMSSGYLFSVARNVVPSLDPNLNDEVKKLIADRSEGFTITSSDSGEDNKLWYGEVRIACRDGAEAAKLIEECKSTMRSMADDVEARLTATPAMPYWRSIANRFPQMLRTLGRYQHYGIENNQVVSNFYLPIESRPNLIVGSWMMLNNKSASKPATVAANKTGNSNSKMPEGGNVTTDQKPLVERLVTINFEQEPLDSALNLLTEEVNSTLGENEPKITLAIDGKAFELASVTRNQQIRDFRFKGEPLRKLLTDLASRVNPDKTITSVKDPKQSVIWVVDQNEGTPRILFTTRRGVEGKNLEIPSEFVP